MNILIILSLLAISGVAVFKSMSSSTKLKKTTRELSDMKNKEISIESHVESIKGDIKSITDLYIASDVLIYIDKEKSVYQEVYNKLSLFYNPAKILLYSFDEEYRVFKKELCIPSNPNFPEKIGYTDMRVQTVFSEREVSIMVLNSKERPLYYLKMEGRREKTADGYLESLFSESDIRNLRIYLKQSAMVLEKIKAYKEMKRMALTDSLTGLYNRHYAHMRIKEEVNRANRENYPVSIVFVDIDKFKSINDTFNHEIGDLALQHVANILKQASREYDITIRWGGEEFVLFLPNTDEKGALYLAERLRQSIASSDFRYCPITASLGIASYPKNGLDIKEIIANADSALYYSKQNGRNQTTVYSNISELDLDAQS